MSNFAVGVRSEADGSLVIHPHGALDADCAVQFRQTLVHAVRKLRPLRMIVDLVEVTAIDPINLGTLAALCDLADDHRVAVFLRNATPGLTGELRAAGVPPQRFGNDGVRLRTA
ncbi:STAS domain-containing protein [Paractinoplanes rhizophilus]|jgi:anti-anti-sigma factor|uniref:STAS domain-containing protein n=1 Tax=Paractinoplanes rhizophilus TaxID=1416877 RepID=A0ABW2I4T1_9ACTN|nr:STAS domain-containing protein [Actinoplanes sp.]